MKKIVTSEPAVVAMLQAGQPSDSAAPAIVAPAYWADACKHLVKKDRVMKRLIPRLGNTSLQSRGDAFSTLARSIVGQQISVKAAQTVWQRFSALLFYLIRPNVLPLDDLGLINGISRNYFSGEAVSRSDAREVAAAWAPYCSVATWYIWRSLDPVTVSVLAPGA